MDAAATDLSDLFTDKPDFSTYRALPVDARIPDTQKQLTPFDEKFDWKSVFESPKLDSAEYFTREKN